MVDRALPQPAGETAAELEERARTMDDLGARKTNPDDRRAYALEARLLRARARALRQQAQRFLLSR